MASQKSIKLYIYESETSSLPFCYPNGEQVEISAFKYNAKRMGGTPTITCTLRSQYCLDSDWKNSIYCVFLDEKFYLRQTPSGTKSNTEYGYSYSLEFVSERDLLNNVYMFDAVNTEEEFDKPASNSTKISFFGDIKRFADKINASLRYSGLQQKDSEGNILGYKVIVDKGITSEEKYILIEDTFFSNAIQEIYNTFEIPYYFKGKEIHIGYKDALIPTVFKYGVDESLLSIRRENANNKIVNRATGFGSTDNIPYYYPNKSPKGDIGADASEGLNVKIVNYERFANQVDIDEVLTYTVGSASVLLTQASDDGNHYDTVSASPVDCVSGQTTKKWFRSHIRIKKTARYRIKGDLWFNGSEQEDFIKYIDFISLQDDKFVEIPRVFNKEDGYFDLGVREAGDYWIIFGFQLTYRGMQRYMVSFNPVVEFDSGWRNAKGKSITLSDAGLEIVGDTVPKDGDTIKQILIKKLNNATNLMPSIYRKTDGRERFYNAINGKYVDESGNPIVFNNPYIEGRPSEDIINVEDIKPTIKECVNSGNQRIDMFSEIAYDDGDNDEVYTDSEGNTAYKHPHFFVKLRKLPFNLFDCAIEGSEMTFSITKGDCGACSFKVKVDDEFPYKNTVQVYEEDTTDDKGVLHKRGTLVKDENGMVLCGLDGFQPKVKPQDIQQDTINNEVWIALEKEEETYGILMPKAPKYNDSGEVVEAGYRIKPCSSDTTDDGDTFVILNIHLPEEYITAAEKKLEDVIIANMKDNNDEKFNFSITFSSIFFEEHPEILSLLDENSQIKIEYAGEQITQFVSSFSYNMNSGSALPSISVELSDSLSVSQNSIKTAINQVQLNVKKALEQESMAQQEAFISKTENDIVNGNIDFRKGLKFGDGGKIEIDENNNTKFIIDYLTVNKKAVFTALDVQDMHHVGGRVLITPASMICNKVEEFADFYRCYFQNYDDGGNQIFNNFVVDDQAICKTLNTWGTTYYWRLVVGVGNNYIDLSKTDCDSNSDAPRAGDKIVQLGNRSTNDNSRKSAIEISAYGDNTPSLVMYTDIDSYSLENKEIHGTIYRNNNGEYEAYFYNYGSMRLGAKEEEDGGYIAYDHKTKQLNINAIVNFLPQSTGLEQMESYQKLVKIAQGNIETWFYDGVSPIQSGAPTMSNYPVNTWEAADYENHIGDIYYSNTGKGYRFKRSGSTWEWEIISDEEMAQLMAEVQNLQYLKTALSDGTTTVAGGLILTSLIQLGYKDAQGVRHTMAGISGLGQNSTATAAWFGGPMVDHELNPDATEFAKSLFRFDGTGYLAKGNITWDENGYGQVGGEGDDYALKWNDKEVRIGPNIKLGAGDETIAMLANLLNMFELDTTSVAGKTLIHAKYDGLYSDGDIAAGGAFAGAPSGGGKTYLNELLDVQLATSSLNVGDMLMWNGVKYVNIPQSSITPDLSAYATQQWVLDKKYLTSVPVTSVVGQTGNISAAQVATALTDAGYKLTDTTYELATTTSNGLMSSSDKVKLNNIEEGANKYIHPTTAGYKHIPSGGSSGQILRWGADGTAVWGEDKDTTYPPATQSANGLMSATDKTKLDGIAENANNYTLPTASSSTKGGIKVGATLSISGEVLNLKSGFPKGTYTKVQIDDYGRVVSGSTLSASDIPNLSWSKITTGKPTTISGYGIEDAYTKTETDNKVAELQSLLDSMFERVYDSKNKLIRIHSNVTISSSGDLVAGSNSEGGGTSGGAYTQLEWNAIKALTQSESGLLASAYSVKEAYNELNTAIETLAGKATNVTFAQTIKSGKQIGSISIDGKSTSLYAPASYAWSEITGKPSFATVATSGSYTDLANKPTIASLMGSTAIGGTSSYIYWNGSAWATKALGSNAFTSISKVSQLTNDSGYITGITKSMVEGVLTGNITSHTHSYIPLSDKGLSNGKVPYYVVFPSYGTLVSLGYNEASTETEDEYYFKGLCKWAIDNFANQGYILLIGNAQPNSIGYCSIQLYSNNGKDANTGLPRYCSGTYISSSYITTNFGCRNYRWNWKGIFDGAATTSSKWANARTITLTGSVTGSVSIDGSQNVSLATTTNHTHTFASLTDKPTTLSGYGITDASRIFRYTIPASGNKGVRITFTAYEPVKITVSGSNQNAQLMLVGTGYGNGGFIRNNFTEFVPSNGMYTWCVSEEDARSVEIFSNRLGPDFVTVESPSPVTFTSISALSTDAVSRHLLTSSNYNSYCPKLDGTGATGTWGINITGGLTSTRISSESEISNDYLKAYASSGSAWKGEISSMAYAAIIGFGNPSRGFQLWATRGNGATASMRYRVGTDDQSAWNTERILIDNETINSYAPKLDGTGATGTWGINISGNAATATNADKLDGVHYQNILERRGSGYSEPATATGWFRIAETLVRIDDGATFLLAIERNYNYTNNESYLFSISTSYNGGISITQLSGYANTRLITKIRVDWANGKIAYVDLYINTSSIKNEYRWYTIGCAKSYTAWTANPTLVGTAYEFTTVQGCKSDRGFTGDIVGNASSATKLQNSRTIWGQSFDGTGNVDGHIKSTLTDLYLYYNTNKAFLQAGPTGIFLGEGTADTTYLSLHGTFIKLCSGSSEKMRISDSGNVGIGTKSPAYRLHVVGDGYFTENVITESDFSSRGNAIIDGYVGIGTQNPSYKLDVVGSGYYTGNLIAAGDVTAGSDIRYKDKIQDLRLSVHDIALAPAFTYKWNNREDDALVHIGSSAQYWLNTDAKDAVYYDKQNDFYHLNYASLALCNTIILARGMETQEEKIARLEERIKELEKRVKQFEQ